MQKQWITKGQRNNGQQKKSKNNGLQKSKKTLPEAQQTQGRASLT